MPITKKESVSWFGALKNSIVTAFFGFIGVILTVLLLFWNEGRAVDTYQSLVEGLDVVVSVPSEQIDPNFDGKLVHVVGPVTVADTAADDQTGVSAPSALALVRTVEMFQWVERKSSETVVQTGGTQETTTVYSYSQEWLSTPQDFNAFEEPDGHENPFMPAYSSDFLVSEARLGAYDVEPDRLAALGVWSMVDIDRTTALDIKSDLGLRGPVDVSGGTIFVGRDSSKPRVGDIRIIYERIDLKEASIVAMQTDQGLRDYETSNGSSLFLSAAGRETIDKMFEDAQASNTFLTWAIRAGGLLLMFVCWSAVFNVIVNFGGIFQPLRSALSIGTATISGLLTLSLGSVVIAIGWFAARPLFSGLLILSALAFSMVYLHLKKTKRVAT